MGVVLQLKRTRDLQEEWAAQTLSEALAAADQPILPEEPESRILAVEGEEEGETLIRRLALAAAAVGISTPLF